LLAKEKRYQIGGITPRTTRLQHNDDGDPIQITNPDRTIKEFTYDSNHLLTSKTDERGNTTSYLYDKYGRISELHSPDYEVLKDGELVREVSVGRFKPEDTQHLINDLPEGVGTEG
jgi:YD repeat-containing protein